MTAADIEHAVADSSRFDVYKLVDAAVAGDAGRRALRILGGVSDGRCRARDRHVGADPGDQDAGGVG